MEEWTGGINEALCKVTLLGRFKGIEPVAKLLQQALFLYNHQFPIPGVYGDGLTRKHLAGEDTLGEHGLYRVLHVPAQRSCAVLGVVGLVHNEVLGGFRQLQMNLLICQPVIQLGNLQVDDAGDVLLGQRLVEHNLIQPVQKLRAEAAAEKPLHLLPGLRGDGAVGADAFQEVLRP